MAASIVAASNHIDELASTLPEVELDEEAQLVGLCNRLLLCDWSTLYDSIVRWYNTMGLCTRPVLVHYSIVVNPCRPIRAGCGALAAGEDSDAPEGERTAGERTRAGARRGGQGAQPTQPRL